MGKTIFIFFFRENTKCMSHKKYAKNHNSIKREHRVL